MIPICMSLRYESSHFTVKRKFKKSLTLQANISILSPLSFSFSNEGKKYFSGCVNTEEENPQVIEMFGVTKKKRHAKYAKEVVWRSVAALIDS